MGVFFFLVLQVDLHPTSVVGILPKERVKEGFVSCQSEEAAGLYHHAPKSYREIPERSRRSFPDTLSLGYYQGCLRFQGRVRRPGQKLKLQKFPCWNHSGRGHSIFNARGHTPAELGSRARGFPKYSLMLYFTLSE